MIKSYGLLVAFAIRAVPVAAEAAEEDMANIPVVRVYWLPLTSEAETQATDEIYDIAPGVVHALCC